MGKSNSWLISGASRGVGLNIVKELLTRDDDSIVIGGARSPEKYEELRELANKYKGRFHILKLDISSSQSVQVPSAHYYSSVRLMRSFQGQFTGRGALLISKACSAEDRVLVFRMLQRRSRKSYPRGWTIFSIMQELQKT